MHQYATPTYRHGECGSGGWPEEPKTGPVKFGLSINRARGPVVLFQPILHAPM